MIDDQIDCGPLFPVSRDSAAWMRETNVSLPEAVLHVAFGPPNGPPLLCLHGVGRSWRDYAPLLPAFIPVWSVVAPDLRRTLEDRARTPGRYLIRDFLGDVTALLRQLERPAVIYGHSLGAMHGCTGCRGMPRPEVPGVVIAERSLLRRGFLESLHEVRRTYRCFGPCRSWPAVQTTWAPSPASWATLSSGATQTAILCGCATFATVHQFDSAPAGYAILILKFIRRSLNAAGATDLNFPRSGRASNARHCCWPAMKAAGACCLPTTQKTS